MGRDGDSSVFKEHLIYLLRQNSPRMRRWDLRGRCLHCGGARQAQCKVMNFTDTRREEMAPRAVDRRWALPGATWLSAQRSAKAG